MSNNNTKLEKETQKEFGKFLIDVAKYIITAVIISSFFKTFNETWIIFTLGSLFASGSLVIGFLLVNQSNKN
jgi:hypothetical protein